MNERCSVEGEKQIEGYNKSAICNIVSMRRIRDNIVNKHPLVNDLCRAGLFIIIPANHMQLNLNLRWLRLEIQVLSHIDHTQSVQ